MNKRLLSALLALCMMLTLFPASAFASADDTEGGIYPLTPAAQDTSPDEKNGSGNVTKVSTEEELINAVNAGGEIELQTDITLSQPLQVSGKTTINGQNHTLSAAALFNGETLIVVGNDANLVLNSCILDGGSTYRGLWIGNSTPSSDYSSAEVYLNGSTIQNGSAADGGGAYLSGYRSGRRYYSAALYMTGSAIKDCTANGSGGGVYLSTAQNKLTLYEGSSIDTCSATQNGGGVYLNGSSADLTMKGSSIKNCTSAQNGGGVYLFGQSAHLTPDTSGSITGCSATSGNGGGIYCGSAGFINLNNCAGITVTDCFAGGQGGGLFFAQNAASHDLSDSEIYNNTANTEGSDIYLSTGNYFCNLPDYTSSDLTHKTDQKRITGWYSDNVGSRYTHNLHTASPLNKSHTLSITDSPMGLVACSTAYDIVFDTSFPSGSQAYSDPSYSEAITSAAPGEHVYLKCDTDGSDTDSRMSLTVVTDGDSPISVPVTHEGDKAYFIMPDTNIKQKVTVSLTVEYKVTVIGGYAGLWTRPTTAISYAKPGDIFCLRFNASGTFKKWVWDATKRPDNLSDDDSKNTQANFPRFTMPNHAVTVWAVTEGNAYQVYVERPEGVDFTNSPVAVSVTGTAPETQAAARAGTAVTSANAGQTVSLTFDPASLPADCHKTFGSWTVTKIADTENSDTESDAVTVAEPTSRTTSFTMPASDVVVTFTLKDAEQPDTPDTPDMPSDGGSGDSGAGAVIAGAVIGAAGYLAGTHVWLNHLYGFIPENRIQLALALWNRTDCPAPESTELYPDIDEDDDDAQAAARWCVEQGLMKDYHKTDKDGNEEVTFKPYRYVFRLQAIKAWYDLEKLLSEQQ